MKLNLQLSAYSELPMVIIRYCCSVGLALIVLTALNFAGRGSATFLHRVGLAAEPQKGAPVAVDEETYYKVLDLVFPRDILKDEMLNYVFILRYEPAFGSESQIVISERQDKIEIVKYVAVDGNIEMKLNRLVQRTRTTDAKRLAKLIRVRKEYASISSRDMRALHDNFLDKLRLSEKARFNAMKDQVTIMADGTGYRLWYKGQTEVQSDFAGSNIRTPTRPDEPPLIDWMKAVYLKVNVNSAAARR